MMLTVTREAGQGEGEEVRPVLAGKLRQPGLRPGAVSRPRLQDRLDRAGQPALTLVSAPAGFGKTTLVGQWLSGTQAASARSVAWVSLEAGDADAVTFWRYVQAAVFRATGIEGPDAQALRKWSRGSGTALIADLLNSLEDLSQDLVLVLDDYHLAESAEVDESVAYLLEHLPLRVRVLMTTRSDPALPLARLRVRGQLLEVRAADLRFTEQEAGSYLAETAGLELTDADVSALTDRTEGWIAALQLAGLSLVGRADASSFIASFAGDDRYVVDYLAEEVLRGLPEDVREFLLSSSILPRLCGDLCDAVAGLGGGSSVLEQLERANLFLTPLDDRREWYRFHQLFADVLTARLVAERSEDVPTLHLRASQWFAEHGFPAEAVRHALAGGDVDRAADLMERFMPVMRRERRDAELSSWVAELPGPVIDARPVLAVAFVGALAQVSAFDTVGQRLDRVERALRASDGSWVNDPPAGLVVVDEAEFRAVPAMVELYRAALALSQSDVQGTAEHARAAQDLAPSDEALVHAAASGLGGLAAWASGDLDAALAAYTRSAEGLRRLGHLADFLGCTIAVGDLLRTQGRLGQALGTYQEALTTTGAASSEALRGSADMHVGIAEVLLERDDLRGAAEQLAASDTCGEGKALPQNRYRWRVVAARLREAEGELDVALRLLDEAEQVYYGDFSPNVRPVPSVRARLWLRRGELDLAQAWALEHRLSANDELTYLREHEHLTLARVLLTRHVLRGDTRSLTQAAGLLDRLLADAEAGGRAGSVVEILVARALAHQADGDRAAGCAALRRAVSMAEPERYVRLFADEGPALVPLLKGLPAGPDGGYVRRLVGACLRTRQPVAEARGPLLEPLSDRERDVLRLLATDLGGPQIAGQLHVSLNTLRTHSRNIFRKLDVTSRRAAVRRADDLGLLLRDARR